MERPGLAAEELLAPGSSATAPTCPRRWTASGAAAHRRQSDRLPRPHFEIEQLIASDLVAARYRVQGTHQGDFLGIPGTGRPVTIQSVESYRLAGGKLAEQWVVMDALGLLQQLGAVPGPG